MTWTPISNEQMALAKGVVLWIRTAREAGYGGENWLPSEADISKSALFERIRSGKEPLAEPPPLGLSCPWYALIEDPGPHYVFDVWRGQGAPSLFATHVICALQNVYHIVETRGDQDFLVRDGLRDTSYRFRLWFDPIWRPPQRVVVGGWLIQNVAFADAKAAP